MYFKRIISIFLLLCLTGLCFAGLNARAEEPKNSGSLLTGSVAGEHSGTENKVSFNYKNEQEMVSAMKLACENDNYQLYYSQSTLAIALKNKETGSVFLSNPYDAESDPYFTGEIEKNLESQIVISYTDTLNKTYSLWSSSDCAELGQYKISEYQNGIKIQMSIGREQEQMLVPAAFTKERFEELTEKMESRGARRMKAFYTLYSLDDIASEDEKNRLMKVYPKIKNEPLYISSNLSAREKKDVESYLKEAGYTMAAYLKDAKDLGITVEEEKFPNFKLEVEYCLTDKGLSVLIPNSSIEYDKEAFYLYSIRVLEFFGAEKPSDSKDGYLFIPDGSGAVISLDEQSENRRIIISKPVYGIDSAKKQNAAESEGQQYFLPVYGVVKNNQSALFAIIEKGDGVSEITAKLGAPNSEYYTVYNTFIYKSQELIALYPKTAAVNSTKYIYLHESVNTESDLMISYYGLYGGQADYSGMAACYRTFLTTRGMNNEISAAPALGIETLGTALYNTSFLGFKFKRDASFTSYSQNRDILDYFIKGDAENISLVLSGWMKNGLDTGAVTTVRFSGALGGRKNFNKLVSYCGDAGISLYPSADLIFVSKDRFFDGFTKRNDAARTLEREYAGISSLLPDTQKYAELRYTVTPPRYEAYFKSFFKKYDRLNVDSVMLDSVGASLNSDFNSNRSYNRAATQELITGLLSAHSENHPLAFKGANAYILPYATELYGIPMTNSGFLGETASVPFLQLVLSGSVKYFSEPLNLTDNVNAELLRCIESGTSPAFLLAADNIMRLKSSDYSSYYAIDFEVLKKNALANYKFVKTALSAAAGTRLTENHRIAPGVACSVFENGAKIFVNYNSEDYKTEGLTIPANNYLVE